MFLSPTSADSCNVMDLLGMLEKQTNLPISFPKNHTDIFLLFNAFVIISKMSNFLSSMRDTVKETVSIMNPRKTNFYVRIKTDFFQLIVNPHF